MCIRDSHYDKPATGCSDPVDFFADDEYASTVAGSLTTGTCYKVCAKVKKDCEKRLLKGGLTLDEWEMTDDGAGLSSPSSPSAPASSASCSFRRLSASTAT